MAVAGSKNSKILKKIFQIRPLVLVAKRFSHDQDIFKFYSDDSGEFSKRFRPLSEGDYERFISRRSLCREPALTRLLTSLSYKVGKQMLSLAEGMPNEDIFPIKKLQMELTNGDHLLMEGAELKTALQYVPSQGLPGLLSELRKYQQELHRPPPLPREVLVTNGAQHGIYKCFELLVDEGDPVLMNEFAYTGAHIALKPYNPEILSIPEDDEGLVPETLESILSERLSRGVKMPKVLYLVANGSNPTGTVIPEERRKKIYELACTYDFLIIEDDPYMYLNYEGPSPPSFLSLDSAGRVIRLDSLSKVLAAGLRAGWTTAPLPLHQRLELHSQADTLHSCTLSQSIVLRLISTRGRLARHLLSTREVYKARRDALERALEPVRHLADWQIPKAGLFFWLKVNGIEDVYNMVFHTAFERGLMLVPGQAFVWDSRAQSRHLRLAFSKIKVQDMPQAARQLADIIRHEQNACQMKQPQRLATQR